MGINKEEQYNAIMNHNMISPNRIKKFGISRTEAIWNKSHGKCIYCGRKLKEPLANPPSKEYDQSIFTVDHMLPISKGGTKDVANLWASCKACNNKKSNGTVEFLRMKMIAEKKHWPKFNQIQYEFLFSRGIDLSKLDHHEFYFEKMHLK